MSTEDLISEVEKHPAIWNTETEEYGNKVERRNAWRSITTKFIPEFDDKPLAEKYEITAIIQKKWKGIRTCYTRELMKRKKEKNLTKETGRKQYVHFESLQFLEGLTRVSTSSVDEEPTTNAGLNTRKEVRKVQEETQKEDEIEKSSDRQSRKRANDEEDELIQVLKKKILQGEKPSGENDEDRLFLLSLVSELHKVPADKKLKLKFDIIAAIYQAQQTFNNDPDMCDTKVVVFTPTHP